MRQAVTVEMGLVMVERGQRLPQRWQTTAAGRERWCEVLGAAGRMEPWLCLLLVLVLLRGCGGALPSVLLAAGCAKKVVFEQRKKSPEHIDGLVEAPCSISWKKGLI